MILQAAEELQPHEPGGPHNGNGDSLHGSSCTVHPELAWAGSKVALTSFGRVPAKATWSLQTTSAPSTLSRGKRATASWRRAGSESLIVFPRAVAAASAKAPEEATTVAASAHPNLREWPMVPEEVQREKIPSLGGHLKASPFT